MSHVRSAILAFGFLFAAAAPGRADDAEARAVVAKAVKAHGGQEKLEKFPAHSANFKGKFHGAGQPIEMTGTMAGQGADRTRLEVEIEAGGMKFRFVNVLAGDKGWTRMGDEVKEMTKDQLTEAKEQAHAAWVGTLAPLKGKEFTLSLIGESKVENKPAVGVKVSGKGRRDVDLYFDKETHLLAKIEARVIDEGSGKEVTDESFPSDYKDVQGVKQAMKFVVKRDGKLFVEGEASDYHLAEKLDAGVFAKP